MGQLRERAGQFVALVGRARGSLQGQGLGESSAELEYVQAIALANLGRLSEAHEHVRAGLSRNPKHHGLLRLAKQLAERS